MEFDDALIGTKYNCPACGRETYLLVENSILVENPIWLAMEAVGKSVLSWYFDTNSVSPSKKSPYNIIIIFCHGAYVIFSTMMLIVGLLYLLPIEISPSTVNGGPGYLSFFESHLKLLKLFSIFFVWFSGYWLYKIIRVIFDIAEYLRQLVNK
jgi:hypothetical protein